MKVSSEGEIVRKFGSAMFARRSRRGVQSGQARGEDLEGGHESKRVGRAKVLPGQPRASKIAGRKEGEALRVDCAGIFACPDFIMVDGRAGNCFGE